MSATSRDVAREAGVSQATVSRVLAGSDKVAPATAARVTAAMATLGFAPNMVARAMRTRRVGTIGVVVSEITNPFYPELTSALADALDARGQRMALFTAEPTEGAALESIRQRLVDGVVFTSVTPQSRTLHEAARLGAPVVLVNRSVTAPAVDSVTSDNEGGAAAVAEHMLAGGRNRIAFIGGPALPSTVTERRDAFVDTLRRRGRPLDPRLTRSGPISYDGGRSAATELLALAEPPDAIFCATDLAAFGALDAVRERGLQVPHDIWVVGYDDLPMSAWSAFDLTTVRQPVAEMAERAVTLLMARIAQPQREPVHERLRADLVVRGTSALD